jgi:polygalacturonase
MASTVLLLAALPILSGAQWSSGGSVGARAAAGSDDDGAGAAAARAALADQLHDRGAHVTGSPRAGMLNVRDFGAIGDGRHDDTVSIQRALLEAGRRAVSFQGCSVGVQCVQLFTQNPSYTAFRDSSHVLC